MKIFLAITLVAFASGPWSHAAGTKPNIIVILADDQGYQDLGCQGAVGIRTPHIDRLAAEGIRLTGFYAGSTCSPTRAALLTGRYPQRYGIAGPVNNPNGGLPPSEITIAELLKAQGYATGLIGKWHLGLPKEKSPVAQGFDYYSGVPLSQIDHGPNPAHDSYWKRQWRIQDAGGRDEVEYNPCEEEFTQRCTKESLAFIDRNKDRPFFLYLAHLMVHHEILASPGFVGKSAKGIYGDACQELDWSVGQVMDKLKQLGLDDNTLVVYASDNGGPSYLNCYPSYKNPKVVQTHPASNHPWRGHKGTTWEGGSRVPCIVRWPGRIPAGRVSDSLVGMVDFLPTIAGLTGAPLPGDRPVDGENIWPLLHGDTTATTRRLHVYHGIWNPKETAVRVGPWKLVNGKQLFNLQEDPPESRDVAARHPAILSGLQAYQTRVAAALKADQPLPPPPAP